MAGREAIRAYWRAEVVDAQDDITFGSETLHADGDRPVPRAAHHHALEDGLPADRLGHR